MRRLINRADNQRGAVLVTALVFLVIMTLLGITAMSTNTLEERMAGNSQDINRAFQAAESGLRSAFSSDTAFAGTTAGYTISEQDNDLGDYSADWEFEVRFRDSEDISGFQDIGEAISSSTFRWYYSDVESGGSTESGASAQVVAGARALGQ